MLYTLICKNHNFLLFVRKGQQLQVKQQINKEKIMEKLKRNTEIKSNEMICCVFL